MVAENQEPHARRATRADSLSAAGVGHEGHKRDGLRGDGQDDQHRV